MSEIQQKKLDEILYRFNGYKDSQDKIMKLYQWGLFCSPTRIKTFLEYPIDLLIEVLKEKNSVIISGLLHQNKEGRDLKFVRDLLSLGFLEQDTITKVYALKVVKEGDKKYSSPLKYLPEEDKKWHKTTYKHTKEVFKKMAPMYDNREDTAIYFGSNVIISFLTSLGFYKVKDLKEKQKIANFCIEVIEGADTNALYTLQNISPSKNDKDIEEYRNYIFKNKQEFIELLKNNSDLPVYMYNNYSELKLSARSSKGDGRQLKVTFDMARQSLMKDLKIKPGYEDLAKIIATYYGTKENVQELLDSAIKIIEEQKSLNIEEHILGDSLSSEDFNDIKPFRKTEENIKKMLEFSAETLSELTDIANTEFGFEWVSKHSYLNFILGRLCDCCSHLDGAGRGIVYQTFVNPAIQTLVIKDKSGNIVAKSTMYLNKKEGYAIFNNVEVANVVAEKDKEKVYKQYKLAIKAFAEKYNSRNTDNPLKKISVGARRNDLLNNIQGDINNSKLDMDNMLTSISFYDDRTGLYNGDSDEAQYLIWEK